MADKLNKKMVVIHARSLDASAPTMRSMLDANGTGRLPVVIKYQKDGAKIVFYHEEIDAKNSIGFLKKDAEAEELFAKIDSEEIELSGIYLTGYNGADFTADVEYTEVVKRQVSVDVNVFKNLILSIVSAGIMSAEEIARNIAVMKSHRCPDDMIVAALSGYRKYDRPANVPKTTYVNTEKNSKKPSLFALALLNAIMRIPTIYEGDKSVGKNMCAETIAMVMGMPFYMITFTRSMTADDIYGTKITDNSASGLLTKDAALNYILAQNGNPDGYCLDLDKAAEFEYLKAKAASVSIIQEESVLVKWLRGGGVMCFNEMNMAEANFFASFANQITDGSGFIDIPGYGRVDINPDCVLIGTQNADYTGVCEQNDATMSRFACLSFPYPASIKDQLVAVVGKDTLDDKYFSQVDKYYKYLLDNVHNNMYNNSCLNIRGFCRALSATAKFPGFTSLTRQIELNVINTCPSDDRISLKKAMESIVTL